MQPNIPYHKAQFGQQPQDMQYQQPQMMYNQQQQMNLDQQQMFQMQQQQMMYQNSLQYGQECSYNFDWEQMHKEAPSAGPYPGITHSAFNEFKSTEQVQFQQYLREVGSYYQNKIPIYKKSMYLFLQANPKYEMTQEEAEIMETYQKEQQYLEHMQYEERQQQLAVEPVAVVPTPVVVPSGEEPKKERKKLSKNAKPLKVEVPPIPKYPTAPSCVNEKEFKVLYQQFLDYYCPTTDFTKFPTPEDHKKKKEEERKRREEEERRRADEKRKLAEAAKAKKQSNQEEPNKLANLKEEKVNIDELEIDSNLFIEPDESRQPLNIVFIGHVDAGKSTLCGRILVDAGEFKEDEIRKFQQEAIENNREGWWLAYCMDINEEERAKGKTVECGRAQFQTKTKRYTLFDAPGHKNYIPNMIMGACQADLAGLIISAKTGEFESGFEKGGQTQEHAFLAKSLGVQHLVVIVTKMDTVDWDKNRFDEIQASIYKFVQSTCQFDNIFIIPIDALAGENCTTVVDKARAPWYNGPCLMQLLDEIKFPVPDAKGPIRIPILDKLRDQGLFVFGKVESGTIVDGLTVSLHPKKVPFTIQGIYNSKDQRMKYAKAGENVKIRVKGIEDDDIQRGYTVCNLTTNPVPSSMEFQAKIRILDLPEHKRIMSQGYTCVIHLHCLVEEVEISLVEAVFDENNKPMKQGFMKSGQEGIVKLQVKNLVCLEKVEILRSMGRFALRDEGRSIAFGEVLKFKSNLPKKEVKEIQQ